MIVDYPNRERITQLNRGDFDGALFSSRNIDLHRKRGSIYPSYKMIVTTTSDSTEVMQSAVGSSTVTFGSSVSGGYYGALLEPAGSAFPVLVASAEETSASASSITKSFTVASGTNRCLVVRVASMDVSGGTAQLPSGITFNGTSMTVAYGVGADVGTNKQLAIADYYLQAPTETTGDVVVTFPASTANIAVQIFYYTGVEQSGSPLTTQDDDYTSIGGGPQTSRSISVSVSGKNYNLLLAMAVSDTATHSHSGLDPTSLFGAEINSVVRYSTLSFGGTRLSAPPSLMVGFCKEQGTVNAVAGIRWWGLDDTGVYETTSAKGDFDKDDSPSLPTITNGKGEGDIKSFNSRVYVAFDTNLYRRTGTAYTTVSTGLESGKKILLVYGDRLYIVSPQKIVSIDTAETVATTTYTLDITQASNENLAISCVRANSNGLWIGTYNNQGGRAKAFFWDGITQDTVETAIDLESGMAMAMTIKNTVPYILDNRGVLSAFNGSYFEEVSRLDFDFKQLYRFDQTENSDRWIHHNGMQTIDEEILMAINTRMADTNDTQIPRTPSGVYAYNEDFGIYHKHAFTNQKDEATVTDMGQVEIVEVGAIYPLIDDEENNLNTDQSDFLVGYAYKEDNSTTRYVVAKSDKRGLDMNASAQNTVALLTYSKISAEQVQDQWEKLYLFFKPLANSTDKIVVKYRVQEYEPVESNITWVNTTSFTSTDADWATIKTNFEADVDYEVEGLQGDGAGFVSHISNITEAGGTYTVTLDETITGATTNTAKVRVDRWNKIAEFTDANEVETYAEFNPDVTSTWIQYRVYILGKEVELQRFLSKSSVNQEI